MRYATLNSMSYDKINYKGRNEPFNRLNVKTKDEYKQVAAVGRQD